MDGNISKLTEEIEESVLSKSKSKRKLSKLVYWLKKDFKEINKFFLVLVFIPLLAYPFIIIGIAYMTPIIISALKELDKKNWLIAFGIVTLTPIILIPFFSGFNLGFILFNISIVGYFLFCYILRNEASEWLAEIIAKEELEKILVEKEKNNDSLDWIVQK